MIDLAELRQYGNQLIEKIPSSVDRWHARILFRATRMEILDLGTKAGQASCRNRVIRLNGPLLKKHAYYVKHTFAHELAHILAYGLHGNAGRGHGDIWKNLMQAFGHEANEFHTLNRKEVDKNRPA